MHFQESETVELKAMVVDDIKKEVVAFANCDGGKLYIGIGDDGTVIGVENPDSAALQISNMVRDAIRPDITMFLHYETIQVEDKHIISVEIQRGTDRPYYIAKKGMRPEGVYVRQGYSSVPATDSAIRRMIKETDGDRFESMRSLNQKLTFETVELEFRRRQIELGPQQMRTLKFMDYDGLYTNMALLLSDQNIHTIKVAAFQGTDQTVFKDRREFSGSLLKQMNEVYDFIDFRNQTRSTIEKLTRIDVRDYPEIAVREALLNLLVHRDYSISASGLISIFDDRLEFVSFGGLMPGIELEDVMAGLSVCRNQELANVFYRLQLIEVYGTGLSKIKKAYEGTSLEPVITTTKNSFKIILPNINAKYEGTPFRPAESGRKAIQTSYHGSKSRSYTTKEAKILDFVREYSEITRPDVEELLGVSASTSTRILRKMIEDGTIIPEGKARGIRYIMGNDMGDWKE